MKSTQIIYLAKELLGCTCPDEVFNKIESHPLKEHDGLKINIGNRLLIYLVDSDKQPKLQEKLASIIEQGVIERNQKGYNRFRLVIHNLKTKEEIEKPILTQFNQSKFVDDKTHCHVLTLPEDFKFS